MSDTRRNWHIFTNFQLCFPQVAIPYEMAVVRFFEEYEQRMEYVVQKDRPNRGLPTVGVVCHPCTLYSLWWRRYLQKALGGLVWLEMFQFVLPNWMELWEGVETFMKLEDFPMAPHNYLQAFGYEPQDEVIEWWRRQCVWEWGPICPAAQLLLRAREYADEFDYY